MDVSIAPFFTRGVALVGATACVLAPISVTSPMVATQSAAATVASEFRLAALDIPYILTLPVVRELIRNRVENFAVWVAGLAKSGIGLAQSLLSIPGVTVEIVREVLELDFVGAFDTFTSAVRDSVVAVGQPLLDSQIWRNQKYYAVQTALRAAVPQAIIDAANGFLVAGSGVATSLIVGTQNLIAAILTLNLGNIVDAVVDGTRGFIAALGDGAGVIVAGIESAQLGLATALATDPPSTTVSDVSGLRTLAADRTISLAQVPDVSGPRAADPSVFAAADGPVAPPQNGSASASKVDGPAADVESGDPSAVAAGVIDSPSADGSDANEPAKKPLRSTEEGDAAEKPVAVTSKDEKGAGAANDAGAVKGPGVDKEKAEGAGEDAAPAAKKESDAAA